MVLMIGCADLAKGAASSDRRQRPEVEMLTRSLVTRCRLSNTGEEVNHRVAGALAAQKI